MSTGDVQCPECGKYIFVSDENPRGIHVCNGTFAELPWIETFAAQDDPVNHPSHYTNTGTECIDVIEQLGLGYHLGNVMKYIWRAGKKNDELEDLRKAKWYLDRYIETLEAR